MKVLADLGLFTVAGAHFHHTTEDDYYWPAVEETVLTRLSWNHWSRSTI